jgi:hypothetical protein
MHRTRAFVTVGSWVLIGLGLLQLYTYVRSSVEPGEDADRQVVEQGITCRLEATGEERPASELLGGLSLGSAVLLAFAGITALGVSRSEDRKLLRSTVIRYAAMTGLLAAISLEHLFAVPTAGLALAFVAYVAAVVSSGREARSAGLSKTMN